MMFTVILYSKGIMILTLIQILQFKVQHKKHFHLDLLLAIAADPGHQDRYSKLWQKWDFCPLHRGFRCFVAPRLQMNAL